MHALIGSTIDCTSLIFIIAYLAEVREASMCAVARFGSCISIQESFGQAVLAGECICLIALYMTHISMQCNRKITFLPAEDVVFYVSLALPSEYELPHLG